MKKHIVFLLVLILNLITGTLHSQALIINEVSNGPAGSQEYIEFVVVDESVVYDCSGSVPPCVDIRGWIIDDNSGYHSVGVSGTGVAPGCNRFSNDLLWSCVPVGTIILIYNNSDANVDLPADDLLMSDANCRIVAPINNTALFEQNPTTPGAAACSYPATGWIAGGDWFNIGMRNAGDCARIVDLAGCEVFSVCWGNNDLNNLIYYTGSGSDNVWFFNDVDPSLQVNWTEGCASCGDQTPGAPNNAANAAYIGQFNNFCAPIPPLVVDSAFVNTGCGCTGIGSITASGSIPGYTYEWYDDTWTTIGQTNDTATNLCAGTYYAIATSSIGCEDTISVIITSSSGITSSSVTTNPLCFGSCDGTATITPLGGTLPYSYVWSNSASTSDFANDLCVGFHSVTITDDLGCVVTDTFTLFDPTLLVLSTTFANPLCFGSSDGSVNLTVVGGTGSYTYLWDDIGASTTQDISGLPDGTYSVTVTDVNTCVQNTLVTITEPDTIIITEVVVDATCGVSDGQICVSMTGGTIPYTQVWNDPSTQTGLCATNLFVGIYQINVTDNNNCVQTLDVIVNNTTSNIFITPAVLDITCNGLENGTIDLTVVSPDAYTMDWTGPGAYTATGDLINNLVPGTYIYTFTDVNSCVVTNSVNVLEPEPLVLSAVVDSASCEFVCDGNITASSIGGTSPYQYSLDNITWGTGLFPNLCDSTYWVYTMDDQGCVDSLDTIVFPVLFEATALVSEIDTLCVNISIIQLVSLGDPGGVWSGTGIIGSASGVFDPAVAGPGNHQIIYTIPGVCGDSDTITIEVLPLDNVIIDPPPIVCEDQIDFNLTTPTLGGLWSGFGIIDNNTGLFSPTISGVGTFTVYLSTSLGLCPDRDSAEVTVLALITPTIDIVGALCINDASIILTADSTGGEWTGVGVTNSSTGAFDPSLANVGNNDVTYTITSQCGLSDVVTIVVNDLPQANIVLQDTIGCAPLTVSFSNTISGPNQSCIWDMGNGTLLDSCNNFEYRFEDGGCFGISLTLTDQSGCASTTIAGTQVCADALPVPNFSYTPNAPTELDSRVDFINESENAEIYQWLLNGAFYSSDFEMYYNFKDLGAGTYPVCLIAENSLGCEDISCQEIVVSEDFSLYVPNAFTPDANGDNDYFGAVLRGPNPVEFNLYVFDRWGMIIFESDNHISQWDGTYLGRNAQEGVYVWKIVYKNQGATERNELIGHVTLLR